MQINNNDLKGKNDNLNNQIRNEKEISSTWRSKWEDLNKELYAYKISHPYPYPNPEKINGGQPGRDDRINGEINDETSYDNSLKLNLYYSLPKYSGMKVPKDLVIYIIPDSAPNKKIISDAKVYEIRCNENNLKRAIGYQVAKYQNGKYVFPELPKGKYLIKICTYYGGYYNYQKNSTGNDSLKIDASPPIR